LLRVAKRKLGTHKRAKKKREEMPNVLQQMRTGGAGDKKNKSSFIFCLVKLCSVFLLEITCFGDMIYEKYHWIILCSKKKSVWCHYFFSLLLVDL